MKNQEKELERRRKFTLRKVHKMLGMEMKQAGDKEDDGALDDEQEVDEACGKDQLKDALRYAERGVKRMSKAIPVDGKDM